MGLTQHFRVKHQHLTLGGRVIEECKLLFQDLHGQETFSVAKTCQNSQRRGKLMFTIVIFFQLPISYGH